MTAIISFVLVVLNILLAMINRWTGKPDLTFACWIFMASYYLFRFVTDKNVWPWIRLVVKCFCGRI